ncbi:MAG: efflux RND transporter permease subunit [Victivallaceae bacterium]|nr:efflux RND transporter permease subunit [Victivallaceae bacterium]
MFSKIFIERPRLAIVISVVIVLAGVISLCKLPVAEYPEIAPPTLYVSASYAGAGAEVIVQTVAMPIEDEINGVDDLLYFSSTCDNSGNYSCSVTFKSGTDTDIAMVNLQNAVKRAEAKLPGDVTKTGITVKKRGGDMLAVFVFMTDGSNMGIMELNNYIEANVKDAISRIDGVSSASIMASQEYSMRIWLDPLRMAGLGISTSDISQAVESQNIQAAAGSIGAENSNRYVNYKLNVKGRLKTVEEFEHIVLRHASDGSIIRLKDVAKVEIGASSYSGKCSSNGRQVVGLAVYRAPDANALSTVNRVKEELAKWGKRFPQGVNCEVAYDPTEFINVSLREILQTIIIALLLVVLITWLFLQDWRATLIPSLAIPVALIGTFPFMLMFDYSINVLTMFGLILVIGSLCDDAIVVVENSQALMSRENLSPKEAALKCMRQISGAIIATTLVTVACYLPLAFYGGMVGEIYIQFAVTMCISLCLSTIVAMTLSPALCAILLRKPAEHPHRFFKPFNVTLDASRKIYSFGVNLLVRRALLTLILFGVAIGTVYFFFKRIDSSFLPQEDKGVIMCNIELPSGASLDRTHKVMDEFHKSVADVKGIKSVMMVSGMSMMSGNGENCAMSILMLDNWDERKTPETQLNAIISQVQQRTRKIADASIICFTPPAIMGLGMTGGATFELCGIGDIDAAALSVTAKKLAMELSARPETRYAMTAYNADTPQLYLDVDREKAETLGVEAKTIFSTLQSKLASLYINDFTMMSRNYKVKMQSRSEFRGTLDDIREIQVKNDSGEMVPLSSLGKLSYMVGPRQITRFNKMTCAGMNAQAAPGVSSKKLIDIVENMAMPENYHAEWTGLSYQERQNEGQIILLMALALIFAYLFLVAQYESWTIPVPVMLTVAFAILGALLGLKLSGETLSIYAQLGMVMLIGLAAKNAILMVEFSKQERENGKSVYEAAMNGANLRYRAVLMTAWSFLFGVFPLVIASGAGSGSRRAIGITTFSGMLLASLIGIVFTPALYSLFQRFREWMKRRLHWSEGKADVTTKEYSNQPV